MPRCLTTTVAWFQGRRACENWRSRPLGDSVPRARRRIRTKGLRQSVRVLNVPKSAMATVPFLASASLDRRKPSAACHGCRIIPGSAPRRISTVAPPLRGAGERVQARHGARRHAVFGRDLPHRRADAVARGAPFVQLVASLLRHRSLPWPFGLDVGIHQWDPGTDRPYFCSMLSMIDSRSANWSCLADSRDSFKIHAAAGTRDSYSSRIRNSMGVGA